MPPTSPPNPYQQHIIDRHKNPLHQGVLSNPTHQLDLANTLCGDNIHLDIILKNDQLDQLAWQGQGCAISTTATDILIDRVQGSTLDQLSNLTDQQFLDILGIELRPSRLKCALLGLNCLRQLSPSDKRQATGDK